MTLRVVKLGGSLLELPDLVARLRAWLANAPPATTVLVVGGGPMVDAVRDAQARHGIDDSAAHWLAIRAMALQAEMLRLRMTELDEPRTLAPIRAAARDGHTAPRTILLDAWRFLREEEPHAVGARLAESWDVTSDSIAARAASLLAADELVLLKSALPGASATPRDLSVAGYVDRFFPQAAADVACVRVVNLRDDAMPERTLTRD